MEKEVLDLNDKKLKEMLSSEKLVLLDFWANWCGHCKAFAPILDKLSQKYKDDINVIKINIDEYQNIASEYEIQSIPTVMFFKNGELISKEVGVKPVSSYEKLIKDNL